MNATRRMRSGWLVGLLLFGAAAASAVVAAQGKPSVDDSMASLVTEVRALRSAVERSTAIAARVQVMLGRVQLQESRLTSLGGQLNDLRVRLRQSQLDQVMAEADFARMTNALESVGVGSEERQALEAQVAAFKQRSRAIAAETAQLRAQESELMESLTAEQGRWSDFNARLEQLEQQLQFAGRSQP